MTLASVYLSFPNSTYGIICARSFALLRANAMSTITWRKGVEGLVMSRPGYLLSERRIRTSVDRVELVGGRGRGKQKEERKEGQRGGRNGTDGGDSRRGWRKRAVL